MASTAVERADVLMERHVTTCPVPVRVLPVGMVSAVTSPVLLGSMVSTVEGAVLAMVNHATRSTVDA